MEAVLGLVPDRRLRAVDHAGRDLLAAMGRQAMHEDGVLLGPLHQPLVDPVGRKHVVAVGAGLAAHGDPGVGDHAIGIGHGRLDIAGDDDLGALAPRPVQHVAAAGAAPPGRRGAARSRTARRHGSRTSPCCCRRRSRHDLARRSAQVLLEGHHIGHELAGMGAVGQAVDDRHRRMPAISSSFSGWLVRSMMTST